MAALASTSCSVPISRRQRLYCTSHTCYTSTPGPNMKESESDRAAERFWPNPAVPKCDLGLTQLCRLALHPVPHLAVLLATYGLYQTQDYGHKEPRLVPHKEDWYNSSVRLHGLPPHARAGRGAGRPEGISSTLRAHFGQLCRTLRAARAALPPTSGSSGSVCRGGTRRRPCRRWFHGHKKDILASASRQL